MRRGARGFTLIELLVVVTIIMILAAMIFPVYEMVTRRAETVHCSSNLQNLSVAISLYAEDNDGVLIPALTGYGSPAVYGTGWDVLLLPYHRNQELYLCLTDQAPNWAAGTTCYKHSYGINLDLTMVGGYKGSGMLHSEIEAPSRTILLFDITAVAHALGSSYGSDKLSRVDPRHNGGSNFAFADGHVRWMRPRETAVGSNNLWLP
jgi:prepilin-type processing-associated H-X9-DG protein/prepilin-type N-terminal cleavage/methylation domain-containing protein